MKMKLKAKYGGGNRKPPKPRVVDVTGMKLYPPAGSGQHKNFQKGGIYNNE